MDPFSKNTCKYRKYCISFQRVNVPPGPIDHGPQVKTSNSKNTYILRYIKEMCGSLVIFQDYVFRSVSFWRKKKLWRKNNISNKKLIISWDFIDGIKVAKWKEVTEKAYIYK